jgi:hypothetical protein
VQVIHALEVIQVDQYQAQGVALSQTARHFPVQAVFQVATIVQPGQGVTVGLFL